MATIQQYRSLLGNPNVQRGLFAIRSAEGTQRYDNPYGVAFGGRRFSDFSDHPGFSASFRQTDGRTNRSTAAGAYQFLGKTWNGVRDQLGLSDFSPQSQDIAALHLIEKRGGLPALVEGNVPGFIQKVNREWASLPGAPYPQPTRSMGQIMSYWNNAPAQAGSNVGDFPGATMSSPYGNLAQTAANMDGPALTYAGLVPQPVAMPAQSPLAEVNGMFGALAGATAASYAMTAGPYQMAGAAYGIPDWATRGA